VRRLVIGVSARQADLPWVTEFFELFKTPWEMAVHGKHYQAVLSTDGGVDGLDAELVLVYASRQLPIDGRFGVVTGTASGPVDIQWQGETLPVYGRIATFRGPASPGAMVAGGAAADYRHESPTTTVYRIGYDLFEEVGYLLSHGQPGSHAAIPTLELHVEVIRQALGTAGISYVEIPARPYQMSLICCLTHDIDFFGIRKHRADGTLAGFVTRGTWGTLVDLIRGRRPAAEAVRNWRAVLSLPFVWLGLTRDFWQPFEDYAREDGARSSTFFVIPFKGRPGVGPDGTAQPRRAAPYGVREIRDEIAARSGVGVEFAVHGIDAWRSAGAGRAELQELTSVTGQNASGIRMHWLYFAEQSPRELEAAGFAYDSTCGYNDAVGYKAGTSQVFRLPGTDDLLELPLTIMDSALFYPDRMGLGRPDAMTRCRGIVQATRRFGGTVVVNWHDRSLAPERQWGASYRELLNELSTGATWFATAGEAVDWFRWRRSIRFNVDEESTRVCVEAPPAPPGLPVASIIARRTAGAGMDVVETRFSGGTEPVCS
jgi:hypothetical protein